MQACRTRGCKNHVSVGYYCGDCRSDRYEAAFCAKVDKTPACWVWIGARKPTGYGNFYAGQYVLAHRFAYELRYGPIAPGLSIDHLCRNTSCVNPAHLEAVTQRQNVHRARPGGMAAVWATRSLCDRCGGGLVATVMRGRKHWRTCEFCGSVRAWTIGDRLAS